MTDYTSKINQIYQAIQFQNGSASEVAQYNAGLISGALTLAQVTGYIEQESYTLNVVNPVIREYQAAFGRVPDQGGLKYWVGVVGANPSALSTLAANFANSAEFYTRYAANATTPASVALVAELYANVLGRQPDAAGLAYWSNSGLDAAQLLYSFSTSSEFIADTAPAITVYQNGEAAIPPSIPTTGSLLDLIPAAGPVTIALTTGLDAPGAGAFATTALGSNTNVVGTFNGTGATFTAGDNITAPTGATNDTLNLSDLGTDGVGNVNTVNATIANIGALTIASGEAVSVNTTGYTGLATLNVTSSQNNGNADTITAAATTAVNVTDTVSANLTAGNLTVNGGSTVTISEANGAFADSGRTITVNGGTGTTSVSVTQTETTAGSNDDQAVAINDVNAGSKTQAGTITSVTVDGLDTKGAMISDNSLSSLTINDVNTAATVTLTDSLTTPTALTLALNLNNNTAVAIVDAHNDYTTINVTTGALASAATISDTAATALTIAGSSTLTLTGSALGAVTSIAVSGAAGLVDPTDFAASTKLTAVTDTSSGQVTLGLNDQVASFSGGTSKGTEIITITADATKAITGDGLATSEIVFDAAASTFSSSFTGANVTGFNVLGVGGASTGGTFTLSATPFKGYTAIDDQGANGAVIFNNVASGTPLAIDAANIGDITYELATAGTATTTANITLGLTATQAAALGLLATAGDFSVVGMNATAASAELTLWDSNSAGLANVSFTVNNSTAGSQDNINYLNDQGLSALTIAGTGDLEIGNSTVNTAFVDLVVSLSITDNSTSTAGLTFNTGITDNSLTTLTLAGSNTATMALGTLTDTATSLTVTDSYAGNVDLTIKDTGTFVTESYTNSSAAGVLTLGSNTGAALSSLTLSGAVADTVSADAVVTGITVTGVTDNSAVSIIVTGGAGLNTTDTFTLGNGKDSVIDPGAGSISVTLGNGNDTVTLLGGGTVNITLGGGANTITTAAGATVTENFGAHAPAVADAVTVGATGASTTAIATITGLNSVSTGSDTITFSGDFGTTGAVVDETTAINTYLSAHTLTATLAIDIAAVLSVTGGDLAQHAVGSFAFGGTTYLVEQANAPGTALGAGDTVVGLVGTTVTGASSATLGHLHLLG